MQFLDIEICGLKRKFPVVSSEIMHLPRHVVFTGGSFEMVRQLLDRAGAEYAGMAAVFKQGDKFPQSYEYLQELPVFTP